MLSLSVDISQLIEELFYDLFGVMFMYLDTCDNIIILHRQGFDITLLDFVIGIIVVSIVLGAFLHTVRPDEFYANRR